MLESLAGRRAQELNNAIRHNLIQWHINIRPIIPKQENLTIPRDDLYNINGIPMSE